MAIIELSDYERWKADQQQKAAAGANVVLGSIDTNPDEVAGDMTLGQDFAKTTGGPVPPLPMVTEYRPVFQQAIERSKNATILSSSPMLADWLKKPENAALARDDLEGLSWFETTMGAGANALKRGVARVPQGVNQMFAFGASQRLADEGRSFGEIVSDRTTIRNRDGEALGNRMIPGPDDLYFAGARYLQSRLMPLLGMDAEEAAVGYQQAAGEIAQRIAETPMSPAGSRYRDVFASMEPTDSLSGDFSQFVSSVADDPAGFLAFLSEVAAESIPMLGATAVVAGATRNPTTAAAFMGTMSGATEAGVSPMEFFQERGVDVSTPDGALAAVMDVDLMREAQKRGVIRGVVIGALDGLSGGVAGQQLAKSPIGNAVLQSVAQAFLGGLGEASAQVAAGQEFNLNDVLIEALAEFVTAPIEVASVGAGQFVRGQRAARDAEDRQALFQELSGQAANSKLRARMPDAFRQFLERATENGPVENVFVPADKFVEYFQGAGLDPFALVDELDGVTADTLRDALATGGDLQIPTATYAASIAGSEHDAFLMENMRFDPDEFTSVEAREFNERAAEALDEAYAEADRMRAEDERFKSFEAEIYETMVSRLRIAGRSTDVATNEAMLYPAFYRVMAERSNLTIEEFMQRYPLPQVRGELPQGVQSREVDELTRTLAEARSFRSTGQARQKTPLLEFISNYGGIEDRGGELRARDAVEIKRGRGRSTLRLARDTSGEGQATMFGSDNTGRAYGPDDVAQAAIAEGLMADNPVVMEYQAAIREGREVPDITRALFDEIDRELRGQATITVDDINADVSDDERMQSLEEYLSQIGVSLDDDDAVIRAAIEGDQAEQRRMYGQDGRIATDSEAFKAWFGDSKVVGPDGQPLVVYHGTGKRFEAFDPEMSADGMFYFTTDKGEFESGDLTTSGQGEIMEVYLSLQNPADQKAAEQYGFDYSRLAAAGYDGMALDADDLNAAWFVAFTPTQIKSVNNRGTFDASDPRILYQGAAEPQIDRPLYVVHNLSADKLRYATELGGLAAPSLAIARGDIGFDQFGEISLIGDPSMADPKKKGVRAFNADVYSPRQPRARFKVKEKDANRVFKAMGSVADDLGFEGRLDISDLSSQGATAIEANVAIKAAWLRSQGEPLPVQYDDPTPAPVPVAGYEAFTSTEGRELWNDPAFEAAVQASKDAFVADREGKMGADLLANIKARLLDENGKVQDEIVIDTARAVARRNMEIANYVPSDRGAVNKYATSIAIDEQIAGREEQYSAWVRSEFGDVIGDAYFEDANGRRRDYTMANIVREMTRGLRDAEGFNYGVGNVRATVAPEFRTMTEIKAARGQVVDSETMDRLKTEVGDEFFALADKFAPYHSSGKSFGWGDIFSEFLKDLPKGQRALTEWQTTIFSEPVPDELLAEAGAYLQKLRDLPTEYFEIKMQRAVGLDEFKVALVPEKASDEAVSTLKGAGLEVLRYGVEGRQAALQRVAGKVFFQQETPNLFEIQGLRSAADLGSGPVPAMDRVADALGAEIVSRAYDTSGLGDEAVLRANGTDLQISIREDETGIYLINIASKVAGDLTERRAGSGVGAAAINALKSYSDETGKPFAVVGSTDPARGFYERMGLTPGDVTLFMDDGYLTVRAFGKNENGFVYQPSGRSFEQKERGSIQFPAAGVGNGDTVISLFRSADLSTLMHESGHYFLTVMQDMAQKGEPGAVEEFQSVKDWWRSNAGAVAKDAMRVMPDVTVTEADVIAALDGGTTGDVLKDAAIDVGMQEQFARGFEAYLMEGKAPSQALRGAFEKFRAWLLSVYKSLRGLNVEISPEIRRVFDRMLATDDEIANAAEASGNLGPVFASAEDMGLSAEDYAAFLRLAQQAEDEASQKLLAETMAPIQRETEKWFKAEKAKVRAEVEREVNTQREYRAVEWMGNRRWLGAETPQGLADMRMSKDMLVARYGAGVLKTLPRGKQTLYAVEGGVDPDVAADVFGFSSGDEMIKALERAVPRKQAIEAETDRVMFERHGDPLADGTVQQMALDAVHGDKRARTLAVELKALTDVAGSDRGITHKEAREIARQTLSRTKVRDAVAANRYLTAERKAGEEAQRLAATVTRTGMWMDAARRKVGVQARAGVREGDTAAPARVSGQVDRANTSTQRYNENVQKLIEAKRRQLLNHAMYAEARRIAAEVESAERLVTRLQKKSTREKLAGDYLEAIDELLQRYDFRKISGRAEDRRGALLAYVERMTAEGRENELAIPDRVLQDAQRTPYKKLTVEHLRGVVDSLKNIEHTARLKKTLQDAQSQRELDAVVEDIVEAFDKNLPKRPPARVGDNAEGRRRSMRGFLDLVLNATTLLREIDGFEDLGAAYRNLKAPIDAAMNRLQGRRQKAAEDLDALYDVYTAKERRAMAVREFIPEVGASLSKWERIAVALNMGNEGNYQRLTDTKVRGGFTEPQVQAIVATLDARDAAFIQTVWDYLETFRPDIEAREKRATGVAPKWVEARPVEIAGRTLNGGYYPLRYDPRLSALARDDATQDIAKSLQAGRFGKAQTRNGHLKERAQSSGRAVELDIAVLHKHVQQVVYDIELSEPVNNSWRILQDARIRDAFMNAGKQTDFDALEIWLKDVAEGELMAADVAGAMARRLKSNFTAAKLAFNLSTVAVQITGVAQSMVVVGKKDFLNGVVASMRPGVVDEITAKSQFMNDRQTTFNKDIFDLYNDPKLGPVASRWTEIRNDWIAPAGFWLMTKVQFYLVDMPTWMAGYQQGLRKFGNEDQAIAHADGIVKRAQASGLFSDRSAIERGSANMRTRQNEFLRLFTTLASYMFAKFNVAYERTGRAQRVISSEGASMASVREAASWTIDMAFLFALEAVLYAAIKGRLPDEEDDEDGDGTADEWALFVARESVMSVAATIPFVRDVTSVIGGFSGGGAYGAITEELARPFQQAGQGEIDAPLVKSIINVTGLATGLPAGQINRAVDAGWRAAEGEDVSPAEYLLGRMGN